MLLVPKAIKTNSPSVGVTLSIQGTGNLSSETIQRKNVIKMKRMHIHKLSRREFYTLGVFPFTYI